MADDKPAESPIKIVLNLDAIPATLWAARRWIAWGPKRLKDKDKISKVPLHPKTLNATSVRNELAWVRLDEAAEIVEANPGLGIGYVFAEGDRMTGIDLDHCRNPATGVIAPAAMRIIEAIGSYTEVSPSGTGVHIICRATLPGRGCKRDHVEIYDRGRFFTVTGHRVPGTPAEIEDRQEEVETLYRRYVGDPQYRPHIEDHVPDPEHEPVEIIDAGLPPELSDLVCDGIGMDRFDGDHSNAVHYVAEQMIDMGHHQDDVVAWLSEPGLYLADRGALSDSRRKGDPRSGAQWVWRYIVGPLVATQKAKTDAFDIEEGDDDDPEPVKRPLHEAVTTPAGGASPGSGRGSIEIPEAPPEQGAPVPAREWVIQNHILAGTLALLAGNPGAGKSMLALQIACSVACNVNLLEPGAGPVRRPGPVVLINGEEPADELIRRLYGIAKRFNLDWAVVRQNIHLISGYEDRVVMATVEEVEANPEAWTPRKQWTQKVVPGRDFDKIMDRVRGVGARLLVLDPLIEFREGFSENDNDLIGSMAALLRGQAGQTGAAILLVHHAHKSASRNPEAHSGDLNFARGASALTGAARQATTLTRMGPASARLYGLDEDRRRRMVKMEDAKANYAEDSAAGWFEKESVGIGNATLEDPEDTVGVLVPVELTPAPPEEEQERVEEVRDTARAVIARAIRGGRLDGGQDPGVTVRDASGWLDVDRRAPDYRARTWQRKLPEMFKHPVFEVVDGDTYAVCMGVLLRDENGESTVAAGDRKLRVTLIGPAPGDGEGEA